MIRVTLIIRLNQRGGKGRMKYSFFFLNLFVLIFYFFLSLRFLEKRIEGLFLGHESMKTPDSPSLSSPRGE